MRRVVSVTHKGRIRAERLWNIMNKKVILAVLAVAIILTVAFVSIWSGRNSKNSEKNINLYFLNEAASSIEQEERKIAYDNADELPGLVLENLLKGPQSKKLRAIAGKNTKVLGTYYNESNLTVDFSKEFLSGDSAKNMLSVYAMVRTLCQIDKIGGVMVTVEGQQVMAADGSLIGFMSNSDINLESDTYTTDSKNIVLYFADKNGKSLVKEVRTIKITDTRPIENYIVSELIKGPVNKELSSVLTSDTELISAETNNGTCHVTFKNFIEKNLSDPTSDKSALAVYSVVNSLTSLNEVNSVRFLFEGKTAEMVGTFDFSQVFEENKKIIKQ